MREEGEGDDVLIHGEKCCMHIYYRGKHTHAYEVLITHTLMFCLICGYNKICFSGDLLIFCACDGFFIWLLRVMHIWAPMYICMLL